MWGKKGKTSDGKLKSKFFLKKETERHNYETKFVGGVGGETHVRQFREFTFNQISVLTPRIFIHFQLKVVEEHSQVANPQRGEIFRAFLDIRFEKRIVPYHCHIKLER
ncbi:hypothetical protein AB6A40_005093 [Gnathostoma spinigerum]|uniref:Uncharacterized protein n=1 Tax=Gnathostoma spinigerum TaxID=75299 RepID=A0ABD6EJR0_9BILA